MLGKYRALGKWRTAKRWQAACNESNARFIQCACQKLRLLEKLPVSSPCCTPEAPDRKYRNDRKEKPAQSAKEYHYAACRSGKYLILLTSCEFILKNKISGPRAYSLGASAAGEV